MEGYQKSVENIDTKMELSSTGDSLKVDTKLIYTGYLAVSLRDAFNYANEEQKREIMKEMAKNFSSSENITSSEVLNKEFEAENANTPLILHVVTKSGELIEKAGNKLIVKIGMA